MELDQRYNAAAPKWRRMLAKMGFPLAYQTLADHAPRQRALRMVDLGVGSGDLSKAYCERRQRPLHHVLLDRSPAMLTEASKVFPKAALACEDLADHHPPIPYDMVLCAHVIEHCPSPQDALKHIARITTPGGSVLLAVSKPHVCQYLIWFKWRHRWFSEHDVVAMAQRAGLVPTTLVPFKHGVPSRVSQGYVFTKPIAKTL